jgi:hypothetical protein
MHKCMAMAPTGFRIGTGLAIVLSLALAGCGGGSGNPPSGPLARAMADLGGGGENGSLGIGWAEPRLARQSGGGAELIAGALGPNADSVIEVAPRLRRRFGLDPLAAERLVSVGGSFAFGLRLDGVDGRRLGRSLTRGDGRVRRAGQLELADLGDYGEVPEPLLRAGVYGLGARDAFGRRLTVLAGSETARASLLGRGGRLLDQPIYGAAADCLGDVLAARMVPAGLLPFVIRKFHRTLSTELGVDLVALGVRADGREILCTLGGTPERARQVATALKTSLAPVARDPSTGESMADIIRAADVVTSSYDGVEVVRAELTLAAGQPQGFLFGAVPRGTIFDLIKGS